MTFKIYLMANIKNKKNKKESKKNSKGRINSIKRKKRRLSKLEKYIIPINIILIIILTISTIFAYGLLKERKANELLRTQCKECKKNPIEVSTYNLGLTEGSSGELRVKFTNIHANKTMWLMTLIDNEDKTCGGKEQIIDCSSMFTMATYEDKPFKLSKGKDTKKVIVLQPQYGLLDNMTEPGYEATTSSTSIYVVSFCSVSDMDAKECEDNATTFSKEFFIEIMR